MGRISCPDFIDRVEESRTLDRALDQAKAGTAPTLFIGGEAGIGKSRLVAEFVRRTAARDATVLTGCCVPFGGSPLSFMPVVEALRGFLRTAAAAERDRLAATVPALGWVLPELGEQPVSWRRPEGFEAGQAAMFSGLLAALEAIAADRPLVLVLEDLHWADRSTLGLLALRTKMRRGPAWCRDRHAPQRRARAGPSAAAPVRRAPPDGPH
jgi:predicted ATPase